LDDSDQIWYAVSWKKCAVKSCKRFPPHPNNVSTLPCET